MFAAIVPTAVCQDRGAVDTQALPKLVTTDGVTQLHVDGRAWLALGGELGNSAAADPGVLNWSLDQCVQIGLNTVLLPVYWGIEPEEFLIVGMGVRVTFAPADGEGKVGIDWVREGRFADDGSFAGKRWLNGDETHQGRHVHLYEGEWRVQRVKLYRY